MGRNEGTDKSVLKPMARWIQRRVMWICGKGNQVFQETSGMKQDTTHTQSESDHANSDSECSYDSSSCSSNGEDYEFADI